MQKLKDYNWRPTYATSDIRPNGKPVDVLHDFYVPALSLSMRYDRVAGYFTSTSLAAASQGFSRFVDNGGKARFIVGMELSLDDAKAIIQGNQARLDEALTSRLDGLEQWPGSVRNGVELLAWMVTNGYLDIKVGLRVGRYDGEPHGFDYGQDGYLHEKWALFSDSEEQLYVSGSLNESVTALAINAENITLTPSWQDGWGAEIIADKSASFEAMWAHEHPYIKTYTLPDAVRERLVRIKDGAKTIHEIDDTPASLPDPSVPQPETVPLSDRERAQFAMIRLAPQMPNGEWVGIETAPVEPWPHQRFVARRLVESYPQNQLLCDEVGLGKTIEAGLAFRGLWLSGRVNSIRVFAPASLTSQWMNEMAEKFLMCFDRRLNRQGKTERINLESSEAEQHHGKLFNSSLEIISTGLLGNKKSGSLLKHMPQTDIALLDEGHKARRQNPDDGKTQPRYNNLYSHVRDELYPRSRSLLLATATPMQLNRVEAFDLLKFMPTAGTVQFSEDLCEIYYHLRQKLLDNDSLEAFELEWLRRYFRNTRTSAPEQWAFVRDYVLDPIVKGDLDAFTDSAVEPFDWEDLRVAMTMLAPLARSMLRHTRSLLREYRDAGLLNAKLADRHVRPEIVRLKAEEQTVYDELQLYCAELANHIAENMEDGKQRAAIGFYLSFLRLRFASSFKALEESLIRRLEKIQKTINYHLDSESYELEDALSEKELSAGDEEQYEALVLKNRTESDLVWEQSAVKRLLDALKRLPKTPSKTRRLLEWIEKRRINNTPRVAQMVIFTRYSDTMDYLHEELTRRLPECPIGTFSGRGGSIRHVGASGKAYLKRTEVKKAFLAGNIDILICTDAAAEGLNLQTADLLVNFDLPWNPMMLEQRIGRIDRIGQRHDRIYVHNYLYQGSVEEVVYDRLFRRFNEALGVTGELQFSLLPIQEEDFARLARTDAEQGKWTTEDLIEEAERRMVRIEERQRLTLFDAKAQKRAYEDLERQAGYNAPAVDLDFIWEALSESDFLKNLGCFVETYGYGNAICLINVPGVPNNVLLTTSRGLYERGIPADDDRDLYFASYGDPVFESLLEAVLGDESEVQKALSSRQPVTQLWIGEQNLVDRHTIPKSDSDSVTPLRVHTSHRLDRKASPSNDHHGRIQMEAVLSVAASLAEQKLKGTADSPGNQIRELESFRHDVSRRSPPICRIPTELSNKPAIEARMEQLLWSFVNKNGTLIPEMDPLFIDVSMRIIERTVYSMSKDKRYASGVATNLRYQAANMRRQ